MLQIADERGHHRTNMSLKYTFPSIWQDDLAKNIQPSKMLWSDNSKMKNAAASQDQTSSGQRSKCSASRFLSSNCVLFIPFFLSGSPQKLS